MISANAGAWSFGSLAANTNKNAEIVIEENEFENIVCELAVILSPHQWIR